MFVPTAQLPGWLQAWVKVNPVTQVSDAARGLLLDLPLGGTLTTSLLWTAAILVVFAPWRSAPTADRPDPRNPRHLAPAAVQARAADDPGHGPDPVPIAVVHVDLPECHRGPHLDPARYTVVTRIG